MGWAFRKDDRDLQAAAEKFLKAQRGDKNSLMNRQFQGAFHMSVDEYTRYVNEMK